MPLDSKIVGTVTGNGAEVDSTNNLRVATPQTVGQAGFVILAGQQAAPGDPSGTLFEPLRMSTQGRLTVGQPTILLNEGFNNTAINSAIFTAPVTTMTVTVTGGALTLNASAITTINTNARVSTYASFPLLTDMATYCIMQVMLTQAPQLNNTVEFGFGIATGSTAPTDGVFFRYDATGTLKGVLNNNGTELYTSGMTVPSASLMHKYKIIVENDRVLFYIDGACTGIINIVSNAIPYPTYALSQPWFARVYNGAVAPTLAQVLKIGSVWIAWQDSATLGKDNATVAAIQGRMSSQGQTGHTMGTTALYSNSLAAGAGAAMTNTTAALGSGLGGQFSAQPTLAAGTDGIVCSYQNPLATSAIPGKTLYIKGVRIQGMVTTALTGGPVQYFYSLAYGATAVSLATAEAATTKAPRRVAIGMETYAAAAAVGTVGSVNGQYMQFLAPIAVNPGEFIQVVAKNVGTVTTAGVITFLVTFDGYFE